MQYCMTMEQTRRIAVFFDSDDDEAAIEKANQILKETPSEDYESLQRGYREDHPRLGLKSMDKGAAKPS